MNSPSDRRWFAEPMLWLVIALPAACVVAGFVTLGIALHSGSLDAASDPVQRTAQVQQTSLAADREAQRLGLSASLLLEHDLATVQVLSDPNATELRLRFIHPMRAEFDSEYTLQRKEDRWVIPVTLPSETRWSVSLSPADRRWRLDGEIQPGQAFAVLTPRFSDD